MQAMKCYRVKGKVQGVGFRYHTAHEAIKLGLTGYARNLSDGDVKVLACGEEQAVQTLYMWLQHGPSTARVDSVHQIECDETTAARDFKMY